MLVGDELKQSGYEHETRGRFRERLRLVGALKAFDDRRQELAVEGLDPGAAFEAAGAEFGFRSGPIPEHWCVVPHKDEIAALEQELRVKKARAGSAGRSWSKKPHVSCCHMWHPINKIDLYMGDNISRCACLTLDTI